MDRHENYMQRCLDLAVLGMGSVSPNPMVGAVIVHDERIIGEGYTSPYGGPHAEVNAVQQVIAQYGEERGRQYIAESVVYVSLEPCAHFGKTPPCADMLIAHGVKNVVIGCLDSFAKVNGLGVDRLKTAGVDVVVGILEDECRYVNRRFLTKITKQRPYVILKWAETANHKFAPKQSQQKWISNAASKQLVHRWRSEEDAILIGANTALIDNPSLTNRLWTGKSPKRILIDKELSVPATGALFNKESDLWIFNAHKVDWQGHVKYIQLENFDLYLPQNILYQLYLSDVQSVIIEGGVRTLQLFIDAGLWDEARVFASTAIWEDGLDAPKLTGKVKERVEIAGDTLLVYHPDY